MVPQAGIGRCCSLQARIKPLPRDILMLMQITRNKKGVNFNEEGQACLQSVKRKSGVALRITPCN
jgi:hypothetical protein